MDERLKKAQEKAEAGQAKSTAAAKKGVEQIKAHERSARESVKQSVGNLKKH